PRPTPVPRTRPPVRPASDRGSCSSPVSSPGRVPLWETRPMIRPRVGVATRLPFRVPCPDAPPMLPHGSGPVADKHTRQIAHALSRPAPDASGLPLFAGKSDPGLFPSPSAGKLAAQKCLADGLVRVVRTETKGKTARELYGLTDKGWEFLLAA